jgi:hypothetical protein
MICATINCGDYSMNLIRYSVLTLVGVLILTLSVGSKASPPPPGQITAGGETLIEKAILDAARNQITELYGFPLFDIKLENLTLSKDNTWASAWLEMTNPESGEVIPTEPTYAIAHWDGNSWIAILPSNSTYQKALDTAPLGLYSEEIRRNLLTMGFQQPQVRLTAPIPGYWLPWEAGKTVYLSRSVAHDGDFPTGNAHYAFDFYVPQTMFDIHAAKGGTVWLFKDTVPTNDHSDVNYIVLKDTTTTPTTYQLYMHLAQNSIPSNLKTIGASVLQGQFIGIADNTGQSTGHHLHFQVETTPTWIYWGTSIDITFNDVDINGGRPRVSVDFPYCTFPGDVCNTSRSAYISGNISQSHGSPPYGDITVPINGVYQNSSILSLSGWAGDPEGNATQARFIAKFGATWEPIGPVFSASSFAYSWDMCSAGVPDGPISLALQILDSDGNWASGLPGFRNVIKHYACPPMPICTPNDNEVALYSEQDYRGTCTLFDPGSYTSPSGFGSLGIDNTASVKVGANVITTLYSNANLSGRGETLFQNDSNLSDNIIGSDTISSLIVWTKGTPPSTPIPVYPVANATFSANTSQSLAWDDGGGAQEYQVELDGKVQAWQSKPYLHLGSVSQIGHTWRVRSRNQNGQSGWSASRSFSVSINSEHPLTLTAPYSDNMENGYNGWSNSNYWDQTLDGNHSPQGQISWKYEVDNAVIGYDNGAANSGDLTSPPILIQSTGYYLRFWYLYETEGPGVHWDQRWVQISVNGGQFSNLLQLSDDPPNTWLLGPVVDLSQYTNDTIRIRFHFETLDSNFNTKKGWFIDDISINQILPPTCPAIGEPDNTPEQARLLTYSSSLNGEICPGGDIDYFAFTASGSGKTSITTSAQSTGSALDTFIFLLDSDGSSVLASNDDQITYTRTDSYLSYSLIAGKTYYVKLRAWDNPSEGSSTHTYTIRLFGNDLYDPVAEITSPPAGTFLANGLNKISVTASDTQSEVSHVEFLWHSGDWQNSDWIFLGTDWEVHDGWSSSLDTTALPDQKEIAVLARVFDWVGNYVDTAAWNLAIDRTPPETSITSMPATQNSTAIRVQWTASDNLSGLDHFDIQQKTDAGSWQDWRINVAGASRQAYFIGQMGHTYSFRMRGVDFLGNSEAYPSNAEMSTSIPGNVCSAGDQWENDNAPTTINFVNTSILSQVHNFCNPVLGSGWLNDQDWLKIDMTAGYRLTVHAIPQNNGAAPVLQLYASNGTSLLNEARPTDHGQTTQLAWTANQNTTVYLKTTDLDGLVAGDGTTYQLQIVMGYPYFLPVLRKSP